jgi:LysR family transcriptional regulator for metE and metH
VPLFDYEPVFVAAAKNPLAQKPYIEAADFKGQTLIVYPVERSKLDAFTELLGPAKVEPAAIRKVELTAVILLLVASNRGVAVLPDWVVRDVKYNSDYVTRPLTKDGLTRRLFAAVREDDVAKPYMAHFNRLGRKIPMKMQGS